MGERGLQIDEIEQLRQRQRDHREIDALAADGDKPGNDGKPGGGGGTGENSEFGRNAPDLEGVRRDVAGGAEKHRMAERQQPAIADQQVEGAGQQRKAERLHHEERIDPGERHDQQQCRHDAERNHLVANGVRCRRQRIVRHGRHVSLPAPSVPKASPAAPAPSGQIPRCWRLQGRSIWSIPRSRQAQSR